MYFCLSSLLSGTIIFEDTFDTFDLDKWEHEITASGGGVSFLFSLFFFFFFCKYFVFQRLQIFLTGNCGNFRRPHVPTYISPDSSGFVIPSGPHGQGAVFDLEDKVPQPQVNELSPAISLADIYINMK